MTRERQNELIYSVILLYTKPTSLLVEEGILHILLNEYFIKRFKLLKFICSINQHLQFSVSINNRQGITFLSFIDLPQLKKIHL